MQKKRIYLQIKPTDCIKPPIHPPFPPLDGRRTGQERHEDDTKAPGQRYLRWRGNRKAKLMMCM